jgi:hypothetical protein
VYGSWFNAATGVTFTTTAGAVLNFLATSTGKTIVTNNNVGLANLNINFNGVGGEWTLGTAIQCSSTLINAGTFDTNGYGLIINSFQRTATLTAAVLTLGNSTASCSGSVPISLNNTLFVLNAVTSTINCSNAGITFTGAGLTFYNVNFISATAAINTVSITGTNTFNNLNVTTTTLQKIITLSNDQTVNGTLTLGATNTAPFRMSVVSSVVGTPRGLVVATLATLADVDFRDIVATGTSAPWSGTRIGNCLGNSNINFDATKNVYWNLAAGGNWTSTAWALTSGGAPAVNNFPLPQDYAIIENTGLNVGATITMNTNADIGLLDMSTRSTAFTLALGNTDPKFYDNVTLSSALTLTGNTAGSPTFNFLGQGTNNVLDTAGVTLPLQQFIINCPTGTLTLVSNTTVELVAATTGTVTLTAGELILNGFTLNTVLFNSNSNTTTRTLTQDTGVINITGGNLTAWNTTASVGLTYTTTPTVNFTYAGSTGTRTISASNTSYINANITAGTDIITNVAGGAFGYLNFTGFSGTLTNAARSIYGDLILSSGMTLTSGVNATTFDRTGTQTITSNGKAMDFPVTFSNSGTTNCLDALTLGPVTARALTFTGGTLNLKSGVTSTVGSFVTTGTTPKFLGSTTPGTQATISDASGTDTVSYLTIKDSNATGGAVWDALSITNVDAGDNTGWLFSSGPRLVNEITMRLRSFAQPRRF